MQAPLAQDTLTIVQVEVMSVVALNTALVTRSLAASGNNTTLKDRLLAAIAAQPIEQEQPAQV